MSTFGKPFIEKVDKRLVSWKKELYFLRGNNYSYQNGVLSNLLIYYISVFSIPIKVAKKIEQLQGNFLWDGGGAKTDHPIKLGGCL